MIQHQVIGAMASSVPQIMTVRLNAVIMSPTRAIHHKFTAHMTIINAWLREVVVLLFPQVQLLLLQLRAVVAAIRKI